MYCKCLRGQKHHQVALLKPHTPHLFSLHCLPGCPSLLACSFFLSLHPFFYPFLTLSFSLAPLPESFSCCLSAPSTPPARSLPTFPLSALPPPKGFYKASKKNCWIFSVFFFFLSFFLCDLAANFNIRAHTQDHERLCKSSAHFVRVALRPPPRPSKSQIISFYWSTSLFSSVPLPALCHGNPACIVMPL